LGFGDVFIDGRTHLLAIAQYGNAVADLERVVLESASLNWQIPFCVLLRT